MAARFPHLMLELKLHVEFDGVTAKPDVVRRVGFVSKDPTIGWVAPHSDQMAETGLAR